jgi:glycosyltransferase involved in cell wall biosynthesis
MNIIVLSKNKGQYISGYYYQDLVDSLQRAGNCYLYGDGYKDYNSDDDFADVISKSPFQESEIDAVICTTSWDYEESTESVDPHPAIDLSVYNKFKKIYFLNKEYKKLQYRLEYSIKQEFDLVCTVNPLATEWEEETGIPFMHLPFGISLERFKDYGCALKYDFAFTGGLHAVHLDYRYLVKKEMFKSILIDKMANSGTELLFSEQPIKDEYRKYKIFWAEFGARKWFGLKSLLPHGEAYARFLNSCKVFLNTPSASDILNTRFLELMATKTLILCPRTDSYQGFLVDGVNCLMFNPDMSDFKTILDDAVNNESKREKIIDYAYILADKHSYDKRVESLFMQLELL